jgi:predicted  nucleic acid-binding Zn-ribbon protein
MVVEVLEKLLVLQDRDLTLAKTIRDLENIPREEKRIENQLSENSQKLNELKAHSLKLEAARKELDLSVQSKRAQIAKYKNQQLETKKNDEYQAIGHQIQTLEKEIVGIEDQELVLMEQYENSQKEVATESAKVREYTQHAEKQKVTLKEKLSTLETKKQELEAEIAQLETSIEKQPLDLYRRILTSKKDSALVPLLHQTTCGGCHMKVTHQTALTAKASSQLVSCEQCGRLLYWLND